MSRNELVDAYLSGAINRRGFIQGLMALGVSSSVAASYAVALRPATVDAAEDLYDLYPKPKKKRKKRRKRKKKKNKKKNRRRGRNRR